LIANPTSSRRSAVSNSKKYAMTEKGDPVFFYPRRACCENLVKRGICMVWHELGCLQELGRLLALLRSGDADAPRCPDGAVEDNGLLGVTDHRVWLSPNAATSRTGSLHGVLQMRDGGHADVLPVLQVPANTADAVPCEGLLLGSSNAAHVRH